MTYVTVLPESARCVPVREVPQLPFAAAHLGPGRPHVWNGSRPPARAGPPATGDRLALPPATGGHVARPHCPAPQSTCRQSETPAARPPERRVLEPEFRVLSAAGYSKYTSRAAVTHDGTTRAPR